MSPVEHEKISDKSNQHEALRLSLIHIRQLRVLKQYHQDIKSSLGIILGFYLPILICISDKYEFSFTVFPPRIYGAIAP